MIGFFTKIYKFFTIRRVSVSGIVLNIACMALGVFYLALPIYSFLWDVFGVILLVTLFNDIFLAYLNSVKLNKTVPLGSKLNWFTYIYLIFFIFGMLFILLSNFLISITYSNSFFANIIMVSFIVVFNFGFFAIGFWIAYIDYKNLNNRDLWDLTLKGSLQRTQKQLKLRKIFKVILGILTLFTIIIGVVLAYSLLFAVWIVGIFIPQFALGASFVFLSTAMLMLKLIDKKKHAKIFTSFAIIGIVLSGIFLIPLLLTPYSEISAEKDFSEAFGEDWEDKIDQAVEDKYFLQSQFWIPGYFLGIPPKDCNYEKDQLFFDGSKSNHSEDEDIKLYFDVFWPKVDAEDMPGIKNGKNSVIIRIHGGAWRMGDKSSGNVMQMNKYFAAQGYVVFDIQYGLAEDSTLNNIPPTPKNLIGDFDVDDMIRHIGEFTKYLAKHHKDYNANLDYVFISGGSAGGHLTCATALGIDCGELNSTFGTDLTIKGMVPFYPANGHSDLPGKKELQNPEKYLLEKNSPPALIYQGTHDLSCGPVSQNIKDAYDDADNEECCVIWLPMAGHGNDIYFSGYYSTVFLYYMERFLYLCVNEQIK